MSKEDIKPCPECGGTASVEFYSRSSDLGGFAVYVRCEQCGHQGMSFLTADDPDEMSNRQRRAAILAWNTTR